MADLLKIKILSPNDVIFQGQARSVSSKNSFGNFDILPYHANFITMVQKEPIIVRDEKNKPVKYDFPLAIIYSANNEVKVYTDIVPKIDQGK